MPRGRASAPAAGTILNALATGVGSAFAIDADTTATVELDVSTGGDTAERAATGSDAGVGDGVTGAITGEVAGVPDADTRLVERCVELVAAAADVSLDAAHVRTESEIPMAAGLKSSSAAANATVLATFDALGVRVTDDPTDEGATADAISRVDACLLGVQAARDAGVTVTGAFDDASASMLGGLTVTDNEQDTVLHRDTPVWEVAVWTPPEQAFSADADVERCRAVAPMADLAADLALGGQYGRAMTVNGLAFCAALEFPTDPLVTAMSDVTGVSLSGTGPSVVAVGDETGVETVADRWAARAGETWLTTTKTDGGRQG
ncbi:shikimate kinase [Halomarina oriensis]|uniref:Shikimate kinase n=1 Tax=Halomarina oriensis TaxID=671145 RepID=A0A6B0GG81_9EURY|nr:shikimate kinase [Halomarina oriensis]MWG33946.1 shikimate kinase [Halomarina oriensis]